MPSSGSVSYPLLSFGVKWAFVVAQMVKNQNEKPGFDPWVGKIPWKREQLPTPVFWPRKFHGQRSLAGYSPWGCKESDTTERLSLSMTLICNLLR